MNRYTKRYVTEKVLGFLKNYYEEKYKVAVYSKTQCRMVSQGTEKISDGLIAFKPIDSNRVYTVTMEVKLNRSYVRLVTGYLLFLFLSMIFLHQLNFVVRLLLSLLVAGFLSYLVMGIFSGRKQSYKLKGAEQIGGYLSDERWIALTTDYYKQIKKQGHFFESEAQKEGIGILTVSAGKAPRIVQEPRRPKAHYKPGFLQYYTDEVEISDWLSEREIIHEKDRKHNISHTIAARTRDSFGNGIRVETKPTVSQSRIKETESTPATCMYGSCKDKVYRDNLCWEHYQDEHYRSK